MDVISGIDEASRSGLVIRVPDGVQEYARRVGRYLGELPRAERDSAIADLAQHLHEAGAFSYSDCIIQFGQPKIYAIELRESLDLVGPPNWRAMKDALALALIFVIVIASAAFIRVHDRLPKTYQPFALGLSSTSLDAVASFGNTLRVAPTTSEKMGEYRFLVQNTSEDIVLVESIGWENVSNGMAPGPYVSAKELWTPRIRIADVPNPTEVIVREFDDPASRELAPFSLRPKQAVLIGMRGSVAACPPGATGFGMGTTINFRVTSRGQHRIVIVNDIYFDLTGCPAT